MRVLVVSSYPPRPCGIGAYAATQVQRLRAEGHAVTVLSPPDGTGDVHVPFHGGRPFRLATRVGDRFDRIVVHFQPALYGRRRNPLAAIGTSLGLLWLVLRRRRTEIVVHEADPPRWWRPDEVILRLAFRAAPVLLFHTEREHRQLERLYRINVRARLLDHRSGVTVGSPLSRSAARERLGLPTDETVFLAPGFIHADKGFERAAEAVRRSGGHLYVVGSVKDPTPANLATLERLRALADGDSVHLIERYVDADDLDAWVAAADAVVLPYRRSWSSGVLARAQAIGTPAVVTAVGGLPEQATERDHVVGDDAELAAVLGRLAGRGATKVRR
ncbi:MAG TPA: glycosyltransferase [Actinomycetota bacterium]|nr:glycosyltransferase [Actinomycetota bacterium]